MSLHRFPLFILALAVCGCSVPDDAEVEQNEAVVRQVLELIDERKLDEAFELYAIDYIYHGPAGQELRGRDSIRGLWEIWLAGFPDLHATVEDMISEGDKVVLRWRIDGTHKGEFLSIPPSNEKITIGLTEIFRISNGQLVEAWDRYDGLSLMQQIGAISMPKPTTAE